MNTHSLLTACLTIVLLGGVARAEEKHPAASVDQVLDSLSQVQAFYETSIAPDGLKVAWVAPPAAKDKTPTHREAGIYVADIEGGQTKPRQVAAGHAIAWSPDSSRLAFLSDREKSGQLQLYTAPVSGGAATKLTKLSGRLAQPRWSPDGKKLAFLFTENAAGVAGPVQAAAPAVGVIGEHVEEQRLAVVDLDTQKARLVSPADVYVYEYDWSPDGRQLTAIAAHGSGDNNWYIAQLYTLELSSGHMESVWKPDMQIAVPRWSPDGKHIAVIGGLMSDEGANGGDVYLLPAHGGKARNLTPGMKASASWLAWLPSGKILLSEQIDGSTGITRLDPADGTVETLWQGAETVASEAHSYEDPAGQGAGNSAYSIALARDGKTSAVIRQSFHQPPEVWAGPVGQWRQLTKANAGRPRFWGDVKSLHWKSDEYTVQGWLLFPREYDPRRSYPLLAWIPTGALGPGHSRSDHL